MTVALENTALGNGDRLAPALGGQRIIRQSGRSTVRKTVRWPPRSVPVGRPGLPPAPGSEWVRGPSVAVMPDAGPSAPPEPAAPMMAGTVRIGIGLGVRTWLHGPEFGEVVDAVEALSFDSLWLSERITGQAPDPIVAMSYAAGRTSRLKFGMSVLVLPGRNPVVLAKELATLAVMSGGRLLPAFGLGVADGREHQAFGVERSERAAWFDEALAVMRACWRGEPVDHDGERFHYEGLVVRPVPKRLDVWLGGIAPSELRRVGRLADGWLPSFVTPATRRTGGG